MGRPRVAASAASHRKLAVQKLAVLEITSTKRSAGIEPATSYRKVPPPSKSGHPDLPLGEVACASRSSLVSGLGCRHSSSLRLSTVAAHSQVPGRGVPA
jgi:hypothetical protein